MAITISGENNNDKILAQDGVIDQISGINIVGLITASHINVGSNIQLGNAGIITATTFVGNLTGNVNSTSPLLLQTGGSERFRITGNNELGIAGANYGTAGQVLTSGGSGSAVSWTTIPTQVTINNNAANRIITGEGGTTLNGESTLTYNGNGTLNVLGASGNTQLALHRTNANTTGITGTIGFYASDGDTVAGLYALGDGDNEGAHLVFKTTTAASGTNPYSDLDERLRITSDGIIETGTAIGASGADVDQRLRVGRDSNCNIAIRATGSTTAYTGIDFGDSGDDRAGRIQYMHNGDYMSFHTNGAGSGASNERLRIKSDGSTFLQTSNVNINRGTSGAGYPLTVRGPSDGDVIRLERANSGQWHFGFDGNTNFKVKSNTTEVLHISNSGAIRSQRTSNASLTLSRNVSVTTTDEPIGVLDFASNTGHTVQARVMGKTRGTNNVGGDLVVETRADGGSLDERVRITGAGKVGIGRDDPAFALDIKSSGYSTLRLNNSSETGHGSHDVRIVGGGSNYQNIYFEGSAFKFNTYNGSSVGERLRITSAGNILINNTNGGAEAINMVGGGGGILISRSASGVPNDGQTLADIGLNSYSSGQTCSSADVLIRGQADGNHSGSSAGSALLLFTKPSSTGPGSAPTERFRIDRNGKIGINNNSPECRGGGIDMSSNVGTSGKSFADLRGESQLIIRNPSTNHHSFTQLLFENGGGTSAATMFRHRLGSSQGSLQNFVGDMCLFRRTGNAGSGAADYRESTRWCGANEQARQVWWASGDSDTSNTNRLGWHHLSAQRDHPGTDAYSFFRLETGAASYARQGMGKYTCVWTTGHASGYGLATGHFGYYMHHGNSRIYVNEHIIYRERYSNGSYYGWDDGPNLRICNSTDSGGTNACIVFRCGGRRYSGGYDMSVIVGLFVDLYVPESANGDTNPRLYVAGNSQSNLDGGGFGSPVNHDYCSFTSSNPNHSGQP